MPRRMHTKHRGGFTAPQHDNRPSFDSYMPSNHDRLEVAVGKAIAAVHAQDRKKGLTEKLARRPELAIARAPEIGRLDFLETQKENVVKAFLNRALQTPSSAAEAAMLLSERGEHELLSELGRTAVEKCDETFWKALLKEKYAGPLLVKIVMSKINYEGLFNEWVKSLETGGRKDLLLELALKIAKQKEEYDFVVNAMYLIRLRSCCLLLGGEEKNKALDAWVAVHLPGLTKEELGVESVEGKVMNAIKFWRDFKRFVGNDKKLAGSLVDFLFLKDEKETLHRIAYGLLEKFKSDSEFRDLRPTFDYIAGTLRLAGEEELCRSLAEEWERLVMMHLMEYIGPSRAVALVEKKCINMRELKDNFRLLVAEIRKLREEGDLIALSVIKEVRLKKRNEMMAAHPVLKDYFDFSVNFQPPMDTVFKWLVTNWAEQGLIPPQDKLIVGFIFQDLALNNDNLSLLNIGRLMADYSPNAVQLTIDNNLLFAFLVNDVLDVAGKTEIAEELRSMWHRARRF